jgi:hypothetical protein
MAHGGKGGHGNRLAIEVLSNRADLLSGGNALVEVKLSKHANPARVRVDPNGTDVTSAFAVRSDGRFVGLVTGLAVGENTLTARESLMDRWLTAIENDHSRRPQRIKVLRNKPSDAFDLCYASTTPHARRFSRTTPTRGSWRGCRSRTTSSSAGSSRSAARTTPSRSRTSSGRVSRAPSRRASATGASRAWGNGSSASRGRG